MYIVLGATGHVGSAVVDALLDAGEAVTVVTRTADKAAAWLAKGARAGVVDVRDADALRDLFRRGDRAFLLNPPAPTSSDTDVEEHRTAAAIAEALSGSELKKVVVESTYGAQPGDRCGDLSILYDFEQAVLRTGVPTTILRAAYYMSNWDALVDAARDGEVPTMYPPDLVIPMVAPADLGRAAAALLREPVERTGIHYVEGPDRYSVSDVAKAFATAMGRPVTISVTPRDQWEHAYRQLGFSEAAAESYARMTAVSVDESFELPDRPTRGTITLDSYISALVAR